MEKTKKMAAAIAAVVNYIKTEQEISFTESEPEGIVIGPPKKVSFAGIWGLSGRQSIMQIRNLMQAKTFHGARLR
jgi:hypothetical protein